MPYTLSIANYFSLVIVLATVVVSFLTYSKKPRTNFAIAFAAFSFIGALWIFSNFLVDISPQLGYNDALLFTRLGLPISAFLPSFLLLFTIYFKTPNAKIKNWLVLLPSLFFIPITFTTLNIQSLVIKNGVVDYSPGIAYAFFLGFFILYFFFAIKNLLSLYRQSGNTAKDQIKYMFIGLVISALFGIFFDTVLPLIGLPQYGSLGPLSTFIFIVSTTYAIIAHHLFDIRIIIKRAIVYTVLLGFTFAIYSAIIFSATTLLNGSTGFNSQTYAANLFGALIIGFSFDPLRRWLEDRTDRFLFKKEYEQQTVIKDLAHKLNNVVALDEAIEMVMQSLVKTLHLRHAITYIFKQGDSGQAVISRIKQIGYNSSTKLMLEPRDFVIDYFSSQTGIYLTDTLGETLQKEKQAIEAHENGHKKVLTDFSAFVREHAIKQTVYKKLETLDVAAAIPLFMEEKLIGLILFSEKLSQDGFSHEDMLLLEVVGAQAISSIQKAKLYEGDQMKSEFVSIASHELLTPISAIEGYLSMILDENIGKVDPQAREYLNKVYTSAKRLSTLIKDLLSVSRIESGKLKIEAQPLDMAKMVQDTIDQLKFVAQDKGIKLNFEKPYKELPAVLADPDRTTQVLVNLVSNAIKYTPKGSVTITAEPVSHPRPMVKVAITDTGLGMTKEQQAHLYEKFYRVDSPQTTGIIGTGLGLYITRSILERMGGSIALKSAPDQGSTFTITLPVFKVEASTMS